jgi:tol-pal system protein YbgF
MGVRFLAATLLMSLAATANAGLFSDNEAHAKIAVQQEQIKAQAAQAQAIEARLAKLEEQIKNQSLLDLLSQIEALNQELRRLSGQIEELRFGIETTQKRQKDFYVDIDSRLRRLETQASAPSASSSAGEAAAPATAAAPVDPAAENRAYDAAFELFRGGNYSAAITGFQNFLKTYPNSSLAPSAQYWIGNGHYALKNYRAAIATQQQLISQFPESSKIPDAWLNIASAQMEMGENKTARRTLEDLVNKYPGSEAADKAKKRLASLR